MITNNKITIAIILVGLVSHSMICYLQTLVKLIHHLFHSSNAINSYLNSRISYIMNSNLQRKINFMTKNCKGSKLLGTNKPSITQSKFTRRQEHILIILMSIDTALQSQLKTPKSLLGLPICLWMI